MKKRRTLIVIILLMSVALTALIAFQLYWIKNSLSINQQRFDQEVQEALNNVAEKLEQQEMLYNAYTGLDYSIKFFLSGESDSFTIAPLPKAELRLPEKSKTFGSIKGQPSFEYSFSDGTGSFNLEMEKEVFLNRNDDETTLKKEILNFYDQFDSLKNKVQDYDMQLAKALNKSDMVKVVLNELFYGKRTITNRINPEELDSLLAAELRNNGIDLNYEYGVSNISQDTLMFAHTSNRENLLESNFKTKLFPNDIIGKASFLYLYFPNETGYLLQQSAITLGSSGVLIFIILICFGYALFIIIRQKKISEIKNDFINNMTHEFKTPIATVSLACEALQDPEIRKIPEFHDRYLRIIKDENNRLGTQVEKVLQMATLEKEDIKLKKDVVDVEEVISKALDNINLQVQKKEGNIDLDLEASEHKVYADKVHLTNIIHNLLDNANKYSPVKPKISIQTYNLNGDVRIKVSDNGIGMTRDTIDKIFEKFYRVPTGNLHDVKGFGLGLTYVKTMVNAHGGNITVKSEPGKGSTFEISLPLYNEQI
ncbi:HAMP domain-containing sensor histidine kinase [Mangrovivirga sp. M17]|uniref:histidine kinase n=1 Tax=Mangrovivirga halotolerans TaxID=2993936 RepID=A0ABT3RS11_9BACT|nr:HAMP domain-containing sensor histidine kinase [Mangrovivirga halotolerans]MCX2744575.1 HAMP domain-containing sensor histidine kinase [Mangrovivirga halotolerans]